MPIPTEAQTVLTTSDGDVLAIFEKNHTRLRGMYALKDEYESQVERRVKINIQSGAIRNMTPKEIRECSLGPRHPVSKDFKMINVNNVPHD